MDSDFPFDHFLPRKDNKNNNKNNLLDSIKVDLEKVNGKFIEAIQPLVPNTHFVSYIKNSLKIESMSDDIVFFECESQFVKDFLVETHRDKINEIASQLVGQLVKIQFKVKSESEKESIPEIPKTAKAASFTLDLDSTSDDMKLKAESKFIDHLKSHNEKMIIDKNKTFANFIIGPSNQLAFATAEAVAKNPGKEGKYPCLYIHSNSGLGKTHLLHAVANGVAERFPVKSIIVISGRDFMKEMINAIRDNKRDDFQRQYSENTDVLMIDDIHELKNRQGTQDEFFHIFNELHSRGKQLIFTSDKSPKDIDGIEERIKTRLQWGLVVDIQRPDLETRIAILKRKATELDFYLDDEILNLIAINFRTSIRELEGYLIKLKAYFDINQSELESETVKELLNLTDDENSREVTLDTIAKATSGYFKISIADLKSKSREKNIVHARHVAMYLSKKRLDVTYKDIAIFYGGRDHTTVMHGVSKTEEKLRHNVSLSKDTISIESNLY